MRKNYPYYNCNQINNLKEMLEISIQKGDFPAFIYKDKTKTYFDYYSDVINISNYLYKNYKNEHIAIIGENSYNYLVLFLGIILSGNVAVLIDKDLNEEKINKLLKTSDTKNVFYSEYSEIKNIKGKKIEDTEKYIEEGKKYTNNSTLDENKEAVIFFTSGTSGPNKAVMLSQKNIANNIYSASSLFKLDGPVLSILPYHHAFGLLTGVYAPFNYHYPVYINSSLKNIMKDMKTAKPQVLFLVPAFVEKFYKQIWTQARRKKMQYLLRAVIRTSNGLKHLGIDIRRTMFKTILDEFGGNIEYIICGGARLSKKYVKWFRSFGIEILNGYGITECSPVVSVNRNEYGRDGSVGEVIKDGIVRIENNEIAFKSDSVMLGYYKDKKSTDECLKDGWFYTGDLGYIDKDGFLFITGRKKNIIILSNGENISPEEIENILSNDKGVCEVVVTHQNDKLVAIIYPTDSYMGDEEYFDKLIYEYNKTVPKNRQIAYTILRSEEFKKNNNRKIIRSKIYEK